MAAVQAGFAFARLYLIPVKARHRLRHRVCAGLLRAVSDAQHALITAHGAVSWWFATGALLWRLHQPTGLETLHIGPL